MHNFKNKGVLSLIRLNFRRTQYNLLKIINLRFKFNSLSINYFHIIILLCVFIVLKKMIKNFCSVKFFYFYYFFNDVIFFNSLIM